MVDWKRSIVFFDPVDCDYFFENYDIRLQQSGEISRNLQDFIADASLKIVKTACGAVVVNVHNPVSTAINMAAIAAANGIGVALPHARRVLARGDELLPLMMHDEQLQLYTVSPKVIPDWVYFVRYGAVQKSEDCRFLVLTDLSDETGLTYAQIRFDPVSLRWDVEYQDGSLDRHWNICFTSGDVEDELAVISDLLIYWAEFGNKVASKAAWTRIAL